MGKGEGEARREEAGDGRKGEERKWRGELGRVSGFSSQPTWQPYQ